LRACGRQRFKTNPEETSNQNMAHSKLLPWLRLLLVPISPFISACGPSASTAPTLTFRDSAGVVIAEGYQSPDNLPQFAVLDTIPVAEVGVRSGGPDQEFGRISGAALLADGHILIADGQARELRMFSFSGDLVWKSGRRGDGPGEFRTLSGIKVTRGGYCPRLGWWQRPCHGHQSSDG